MIYKLVIILIELLKTKKERSKDKTKIKNFT